MSDIWIIMRFLKGDIHIEIETSASASKVGDEVSVLLW